MLEFPYDGDLSAKENLNYKEFNDKVNNYVESLLEGYIPQKHSENKVIHDPVWGTMLFYPWELKIIDSPLLQRLRNISQLGLAMLTYPSAHHSRFEHTLGVMSVVTKMVNHINQKDEAVISNEDFHTLRLAALLHDVGHCFFSHLSESIYGKLDKFVELKNSFRIFESAKEHEIFSYIIINSESFRKFILEKVQLFTEPMDRGILEKFFRKVGYLIVGATLPPEETKSGGIVIKHYLTQIINGQYDADKLDYLRRDSYTAGLALTYDIDRFLYKIMIRDNDEYINDGKTRICGKHLVVPVAGITAVEEMAFSQLMLASYIYQHQKVLAADALIRDIVFALAKNKKLSHPCDFLYFCDCDILGIYNNITDEEFKIKISEKTINTATRTKIADIVKKIKNRDLPKRAFIINTSTVKPDENGRYPKPYPASDIAERLEKIIDLRNDIVVISREIAGSKYVPDDLKKNIDDFDIHISIPNTSIAKDLSNALVLTKNKKFKKLSEIVRLSDWADAFAWHKWNAYVFANEAILPIVAIASKIVFERHGLIFNDDKVVFAGIKCSDTIIELIKKLKDNGEYPL